MLEPELEAENKSEAGKGSVEFGKEIYYYVLRGPVYDKNRDFRTTGTRTSTNNITVDT